MGSRGHLRYGTRVTRHPARRRLPLSREPRSWLPGLIEVAQCPTGSLLEVEPCFYGEQVMNEAFSAVSRISPSSRTVISMEADGSRFRQVTSERILIE